MAGNKSVNQKESVSSNKPELNVDELISKNAQLQSDIDSLKALMQQLIESQSQKKEEVKSEVVTATQNVTEDSDRDYSIIPPNKLVKVTSLFYGGMTLRGSNEKKIRFARFGDTKPISYEDLTYICTNHESLAEQGAFFIHDAEVVRSLYLERTYAKILDIKKIESLISLEHDKIDEIVSSLTEIQMNTVENVIIQGIIDGNSKYSNWSKIDIIEKHCKKNLRKIAQERMEDEK